VTTAGDVLGSPELWAGAAAALVGVGLVIVTRQRIRLSLGLAVAVGGAAFPLADAWWFWTVVLVAVALWVRDGDDSDPAVLASWAAAAAAYVCVPDTELALVLAGAVAAAGLGALMLGWSWRASGAVVSATLVWIAVTDGSPRASAVVGTLAVAVIHALLQRGLPARARPWPRLVVGSVAMLVCARVAGLGDGVLRPLVIAGAVVALVAGLERSRPRAGPNL
jgi:hypothetical protein